MFSVMQRQKTEIYLTPNTSQIYWIILKIISPPLALVFGMPLCLGCGCRSKGYRLGVNSDRVLNPVRVISTHFCREASSAIETPFRALETGQFFLVFSANFLSSSSSISGT